MATLSTLGQMMLNLDPGIKPYSEAEVTANRIQGGRINNQTALLSLQEAQRAQAAEAEYLRAIQTDPVLRQQVFGGGPVLGSLQTAPGAPGGGPMTQQQVLPGQPPGAPQVVPGGQDLSQFATQGAPGTPTLATIGPQGQPQAPQNPLLAMAQRDPRAALLLQRQMQTQQDREWKMQEQRLDIGVKVSEAVARQLQGVTDQASLDAARERVRLIHPQAAAQIPQFYSKEAVEVLQQRGIAVAEVAKWRKDMASARQTEVTTEHLPKVFGALEQFATGSTGGPSQAPAEPTTTTTGAVAPTSRQPAAPPAFETAIADAHRLYPQVSPTRIKAIIAAESNFDPKAVSPAGAKGPMQLMDATAKDMGVDDPFDITQNVRGGTRYYAQMLTKYGGDERKALAAYNWGPENLDKVGGDVTKAPPETQAYVAKVLGGGSGSPVTTGGTGTAQAPKADPRVAQLQARIDQGNKAALQAEMVGMEGPARQIRAQVAQLEDERKRLVDQGITERHRAEEIPRAGQRVTVEEQARYGEKQRQQAGPMLPEARRDFFAKLRTDIRQEPTFQTYQQVRNGYQNVQIGAADNNAIGDLAITNGISKIFDPGSAVMRGEAQTVEEAQGRLQVILNSPKRFFEGDRLTTTARAEILALAQKLARQKLTTAEKELRQVYEPFAKEGGFQFSQLLPLEEMPAPSGLTPAQDALLKKHTR